MVINISVQYSGGLLPDITLLTVDPRLLPVVGNPFKYHVKWLYFVFIAFVMYITTITMYDGVLHCLWFVFNVFSGVPAWRLIM